MKLADMRGRIKVVTDEMKALAAIDPDQRSDDQNDTLDTLYAEFTDLKGKIEREAGFEDVIRSLGGRTQERASGVVPQPGAEEAEKRVAEYQTHGHRFAHHEDLEDFRRSGGKGAIPRAATPVGSFYHRDDVNHAAAGGPIDRRDLVYTGALPADYIAPTQMSGFYRGDDLQGSLRSVLINGQTSSDSIVFFRELSATNAAAAVAQATASDGTTGLKPESAITFEQDDVPVVTIATHMPITRQTIWDAPQMQTYVEQRLLDFLRLEESDQFLNGDGVGANMTGILNTTGIQYLDNTATTGYWATNPLASASADRENFDRILHAKTVARVTGRARPNFVVLNPADLEKYLMTVDANNQYYGAGPFGGTNLPSLWGLSVVEDENIAEGEALVGDGRMAAVFDRMQSQIMIDTINDQFIRNMLTILAEERVALAVFRPAAFVHVELAAWA